MDRWAGQAVGLIQLAIRLATVIAKSSIGRRSSPNTQSFLQKVTKRTEIRTKLFYSLPSFPLLSSVQTNLGYERHPARSLQAFRDAIPPANAHAGLLRGKPGALSSPVSSDAVGANHSRSGRAIESESRKMSLSGAGRAKPVTLTPSRQGAKRQSATQDSACNRACPSSCPSSCLAVLAGRRRKRTKSDSGRSAVFAQTKWGVACPAWLR
jgi:hypothetical protein